MNAEYMVLKGARLIDGSGNTPVEDAVVVIRGNHIQSVGTVQTVENPKDAVVLDLTAKTVLPGLIDAHVHLAGWNSMTLLDFVTDDPLVRAMRSVRDAGRLIQAGFTTVREVGSANALRLKVAIAEGSVIGPRILAAGRYISQTGGSGDTVHSLPLEWMERVGGGRMADGADEVRKAAREQLREGADLLKIMATGAVLSNDRATVSTQFTRDEIRALVEEARNAGVKTASHAHGTQGIKNSIACGIDSIEHGTFLDDGCIEAMLKEGTFLVPTLAIFDVLAQRGLEAGLSPDQVSKAQNNQRVHLKNFKKAYRAGVKCGLGSDYLSDPLSPMGKNAIELQLYVEKAGLTPMQAIVCATRGNAELLGLSDQIGTVEAGKRADLLVVAGNPLEDIRVLGNRQKICAVYKDGTEVPRPQMG